MKLVRNDLEIELRFSKYTIQQEMAEKAKQMFCDLAQNVVGSVEPDFFRLDACSEAPFFPFRVRVVAEKAWAHVFVVEGVKPDAANIGMEVLFYDSRADLLATATLCEVYRGEGFGVFVDDMVDNPSMELQVEFQAARAIN